MEIVETETKAVVLNEQPEFSACDDVDVSASYFILCEEDLDTSLSKNVYDFKIAGMSILNWVVRVCDEQPTILKVSKYDDVLRAIKPYLGDSDYSVVLYANTPLLNKGHIKDLLGFVSRKHMNVCKLKKGFVLKNDYIANVDEIYSIDTYDFASNDMFEVKNYDDLSYAGEVLSKKVINYHKKNGVYFENPSLVNIDATTEIGYGSKISAGVSVLNHSTVFDGVKIDVGTVVSNSKIGEDVKIGKNVLIEDSVIKDGVQIESGAVVKGSVVGQSVKIGACSKIVASGIKNDSIVHELAEISNARIAENCEICKCAKVLGNKITTLVSKDSLVGANATVVDCKLQEKFEIETCGKVISNKKVND